MELSFENTEVAFAYKSDKELRKARFLFSLMGIGWLVRMGTSITPWLMKFRMPVNGLLRNTIFRQFVGGESLEDTKPVVARLEKFGVKVILDFGVEGKTGEANFELSKNEFIKVIEYAAHEPNIQFMSVKLTGFARFGLLEKIHKSMDTAAAINGEVNVNALNEVELKEWKAIERRVTEICECAKKHDVGVLIDAEESWIQNPVDALCMQMMERFNKNKVYVYNTMQLYRIDRLQFLKDSFNMAGIKHFILGAKLVRGAYMEKERKRAVIMDYASPIHQDKRGCDSDYNAAIEFCVDHLDKLFLIVASHNEYRTKMFFSRSPSCALFPIIWYER